MQEHQTFETWSWEGLMRSRNKKKAKISLNEDRVEEKECVEVDRASEAKFRFQGGLWVVLSAEKRIYSDICGLEKPSSCFVGNGL